MDASPTRKWFGVTGHTLGFARHLKQNRVLVGIVCRIRPPCEPTCHLFQTIPNLGISFPNLASGAWPHTHRLCGPFDTK
jgi:hypothetical protein